MTLADYASVDLPCTADPDLWTGEKYSIIAARICRACPAIAACRAAGQDATCGVWAGEIKQPLTDETVTEHELVAA